MAAPRRKRSAAEYQEALRKLQSARTASRLEADDDPRSYSLEGLRLAGLLRQMQSLQAVQGLAELRPKEKGTKRRFVFSEDARERAAQRQWLLFKADWLESLLEDAVDELLALNDFESKGKRQDGP
jgi:hypothetical protein